MFGLPEHQSRRSVIASLLNLPLALRFSRCAAVAQGVGAFADASDATVPAPMSPSENIRTIIGGDGEITAALAEIKKRGLTRAFLPSGRYTVASEYEIGDLTLICDPDANIAPATSHAGKFMFTATGTTVELPPLSSPVRAGDTALVFALVSNLAPGDWVCITNPQDGSWLKTRPYYRAGEWVQVASVDPSNTHRILLRERVLWAYDHRLVDLRVARLASPKVVGGNWLTGEKRAVKFSFCSGKFLEQFQGTSRAYETILIDRCVDFEAHIVFGRNEGIGSDDYFVTVSNSHKGRLHGGDVYARRHPVALGGGDVICGVPTRFIEVGFKSLSNDIRSGSYVADFHGNSEFCRYTNTAIRGAASLGGKDNGYEGCDIAQSSTGKCVEATEVKGGELFIKNARLSTDAVHLANGIFDLGGTSNVFTDFVTNDVDFHFENLAIAAKSLQSGNTIFNFRNAGCRKAVNFKIFDIRMNVSQPLELVRTNNESGLARTNIDVQRIAGLKPGSRLHFALDKDL